MIDYWCVRAEIAMDGPIPGQEVLDAVRAQIEKAMRANSVSSTRLVSDLTPVSSFVPLN